MQKINKYLKMFLSLLLVSFIGTSCGSNRIPDSQITDNTDSSINYQIFVRSFADSNGDGVGDLNGIKNKIPYLKKLGVKNIWLTPIHKTSTDHGYDVEDYYSIASDLGTMEDFEALVDELNKNNMGIILDMVFNHASSKTTYFQEAYEDYKTIQSGKPVSDSKAKWFNFSTQPKIGYIKYKDYYVESRFDNHGMMDFNLQNAGVMEELGNILTFWKDKGVAGYRFDAVKYFVGSGFTDESVEILNQLKAFAPDLYFIGEGWDEDVYTFNKYYQSDFDAFFNFPMSAGCSKTTNVASSTINKSVQNLYTTVLSNQKAIKDSNDLHSKNSVSANFLTNHDMDRVAKLSKYPEKIKMVASVNYLLPGTPFIYYGEELGMKGVRPAEAMTDADRRMAMLFEDESKCNNLRGTTFSDQITEGVTTQEELPNSTLNHYIRLTSLRNKMGLTARNGTYSVYDSEYTKNHKTIYAYTLSDDTNSYQILMNLGEENVDLTLTKEYTDVVGYVNALDIANNYTLNNKSLSLPAYGTIILK